MIVPAAQPARHPLDDEFVLRERILRPGVALETTARFRDDRWPLRPALLQRSHKALTLNFENIPAGYRLVAKELCFAMLSGQLPSGEPRLELPSIHSTFCGLRQFLTWLDTRTPLPGRPAQPALTELTGADLQAYQRHLMATVPSRATRDYRRGALRYLWRYRTVITSDRLPFDPGDIEGWQEPRHGTAAENATDRIPEPVHGPLLAWAMRFIDDFARDILAADRQWRLLRDRPCNRPAGRPPNCDTTVRDGLRAFLDDHLTRRLPLPGWQGKVNVWFLSRTLGCATNSIYRYHADIDAVADVVGVSPYTYFNITITGQLEGRPWMEGIATDPTADVGLATLARMLHVACYIVIAFLSGMRDTEVKHLRRGCLSAQRDADGRVCRWKATSLAFKGESDPAGLEATWVIGAPAARAIDVLQRLQPPEVDLLFAQLAHGVGNNKHGQRDTALESGTTNLHLNDFVRWINDYCAAHSRGDGIPLVNKRVWRLSTRQFRRTLAWFIARRPGGAIAGAIAY